MRILLWMGLALCMFVGGCAQTSRAPLAKSGDISANLIAGDLAYARGAYEVAAARWREVIEVDSHSVEARCRLANAQVMLGRYDLAAQTLQVAWEDAASAEDKPRQIRILNTLGVAYTLNPRAGAAREAARPGAEHCEQLPADALGTLNRALELAKELNDVAQEASICNNLGNFHARSADDKNARLAYALAARLAGQSRQDLLAAKAAVNAAVAVANVAEATPALLADAQNDNRRAGDLVSALPESSDKGFLLVTLGQTWEQLSRLSPDAPAALARANEAYQSALKVSQAIGDLRTRSYAAGYLAGVILVQNVERAVELAQAHNRRALLDAQQGELPDAIFHWQWQGARIIRKRWEVSQEAVDLDQAIAFYDGAVQTLKFIRNDISLGHGNGRKRLGFRDSIGGVYFEYADLLLRRADQSQGVSSDGVARAAAVIDDCTRARDTIESLKAVELENYFQDQCVHLLKTRRKDLETTIDPHTAVVYLIPLEDRTEILVSFSDRQFARRTSKSFNATALRGLASRFREELCQVADFSYQTTGERLYGALIKPIRPLLDDRQITTLVFVPDGPLRSIPMAALFDGEKHLIESFAIAVVPGLDMLDSKGIARTQMNVLASGLSQEVKDFKKLDMVPQELEAISGFFPRQTTTLYNENFNQLHLTQAMDRKPFTIVHMATHAMFGNDASESFILTHNGTRLKMNDLEQLLRPFSLRDQPVELLTLSACQTAVAEGRNTSAEAQLINERAALGLAGIAVKAGARSAVGTLWSVDQKASVGLMTEFYRELSSGKGMTKARAMQAAQIKLLQGAPGHEKYRDPYYWAPFLVIGNWQ